MISKRYSNTARRFCCLCVVMLQIATHYKSHFEKKQLVFTDWRFKSGKFQNQWYNKWENKWINRMRIALHHCHCQYKFDCEEKQVATKRKTEFGTLFSRCFFHERYVEFQHSENITFAWWSAHSGVYRRMHMRMRIKFIIEFIIKEKRYLIQIANCKMKFSVYFVQMYIYVLGTNSVWGIFYTSIPRVCHTSKNWDAFIVI